MKENIYVIKADGTKLSLAQQSLKSLRRGGASSKVAESILPDNPEKIGSLSCWYNCQYSAITEVT